MRKLTLVAIALLALCQAQQNDTFSSTYFTGKMINGRLWQNFDSDQRLWFLSGIHDQIVLDTLNSEEKPTDANLKWASGFTVDDYIKELTALYRDRENIKIPGVLAVDHCTVKLKGTVTKDVLEARLIILRKMAADLR